MNLVLAAAASLTVVADLNVLSWNVESGRNDPNVIARELTELNTDRGRAKYDLICLTEVKSVNAESYRRALKVGTADYQLVVSSNGNDDRIALLYRRDRFRRTDRGSAAGRPTELSSHDGETFPAGGNRRPCVVQLQDQRNGGLEFLFMGNHLNRGTNRTRQTQARLLREWVKVQTLPVIATGDYNFDFDFQHLTGNQAMSIFLRDPASEGGRFAWKWVIPDTEVRVVGQGGTRYVEIVGELQDTNWYDGDGDGEDDYPDSFLDFVFLGASARRWPATSTVIVRPGDFPDGPQRSDHRPVAALISPLPASSTPVR